jgi:hypothetical protein
MASQAQITANYQNAKRSTGPVTDAGKDISSRNSLRHGLTARKILLSVEDKVEFDEIRADFLAAFAPKTRYEQLLLEDTVRAYWSWSRVQCAHTAFLDKVVQGECGMANRMTPERALARIFTEEQHAKSLRLLMRYEAAAERTYRRCKQDLERQISARRQSETLQPAAKPAAERAAAPEPVEPIGFVSQPVPQTAAPQRC